MEIDLHVFPKSGTQTHRWTDTATLYIYVDVNRFSIQILNAKIAKKEVSCYKHKETDILHI